MAEEDCRWPAMLEEEAHHQKVCHASAREEHRSNIEVMRGGPVAEASSSNG